MSEPMVTVMNAVGRINARNGWHERTETLLELGPSAALTDHIASKLALIHSEVSEALEELREGSPVHVIRHYETDEGEERLEGFPIELADVVIRCLDLAYTLQIDLPLAIDHKLAVNAQRGYMHGGKKL